jgi:hypothetical protein
MWVVAARRVWVVAARQGGHIVDIADERTPNPSPPALSHTHTHTDTHTHTHTHIHTHTHRANNVHMCVRKRCAQTMCMHVRAVVLDGYGGVCGDAVVRITMGEAAPSPPPPSLNDGVPRLDGRTCSNPVRKRSCAVGVLLQLCCNCVAHRVAGVRQCNLAAGVQQLWCSSVRGAGPALCHHDPPPQRTP